ncbi:MAG: TIGR00730 family Rossman fold protein [Planctomycetota bacterium]
MRRLNRVCVFCGAHTGRDPRYAEAARRLGHRIAERRIGVVFGGGKVGLMGVLADGALEKGGEVIGVIPEALATRELAHPDVTEMRVVEGMHPRKATMAELSDAFIAMPGGLGTFEELFEVLTWSQLGFHRKPVGLLDSGGYFHGLLEMLERSRAEGFIPDEQSDLLVVAEDPDELLDLLIRVELPDVPRWLTSKDEI